MKIKEKEEKSIHDIKEAGRIIRHALIDTYIYFEIFIENIISEYCCESEKKLETFRNNIIIDLTFEKKLQILKKLKLYNEDYINISEKEYIKGIEIIRWSQRMRNKVAHNLAIPNPKENSLNLLLKAKTPLKIGVEFMKKAGNHHRLGMSFLAGLMTEIYKHKGKS